MSDTKKLHKKIKELKSQNTALQNTITSQTQELDFLNRISSAYEKILALSHSELLDAVNTIEAFGKLQVLSDQEKLKLSSYIDRTQKKIDKNETVKIKDILNEDIFNEERILDEFSSINEGDVSVIHANLFKTLTHFNFPEEEAFRYWQEIIGHLKTISLKLNRNVGFRVALLDYFININRKLRDPKIIEIKFFQRAIKQAVVDQLTGVYNRNFFENYIDGEFSRSIRYGKSIGYLLLDIDDFKQLNDSKGHDYGDSVLRDFGSFLNKISRNEDIVCRYGGEEFLIICPETDLEGLEIVTRRLIAEHREINAEFTFSGGAAVYPLHATEKNDLFHRTDAALYKAKRHGKNRIEIYSEDTE